MIMKPTVREVYQPQIRPKGYTLRSGISDPTGHRFTTWFEGEEEVPPHGPIKDRDWVSLLSNQENTIVGFWTITTDERGPLIIPGWVLV